MARPAITLAQLDNRLRVINRALEADILEFHRSIARTILYEVVERTPVDTGRARSNWTVTLRSPALGLRWAFSPIPSRWRRPYGPGGSRGETANLQAAVRQGNAVLAGLQSSEHMSTFISNNLPYILRLTRGWSNQSPTGLIIGGVRAGVAQAVSQFRFRNVERIS